jgi:NAD(P)-dependent dehydrogenase (short-subunit alcohol dehydrogenase family)
MTRAVLPSMRRRRAGTIVNLSSIRGLIGYSTNTYYCATKFAIEGFTEALAREVEPFGIHVIALEPTGFRTDFFGRSLAMPRRTIEEYREAVALRALHRSGQNVERGDPKKLAAALLRAVDSPHPPRHLLMGADALPRVRERFELLLKEWEQWQELTVSTDA